MFCWSTMVSWSNPQASASRASSAICSTVSSRPIPTLNSRAMAAYLLEVSATVLPILVARRAVVQPGSGHLLRTRMDGDGRSAESGHDLFGEGAHLGVAVDGGEEGGGDVLHAESLELVDPLADVFGRAGQVDEVDHPRGYELAVGRVELLVLVLV